MCYFYSVRRVSMGVSQTRYTVNFLDVSRHTLNPIKTLYKQHGYLNKNNSRHTVNFFPFSRHTVNFLDVSRHTLNPIETLCQARASMTFAMIFIKYS